MLTEKSCTDTFQTTKSVFCNDSSKLTAAISNTDQDLKKKKKTTLQKQNKTTQTPKQNKITPLTERKRDKNKDRERSSQGNKNTPSCQKLPVASRQETHCLQKNHWRQEMAEVPWNLSHSWT